MTLYIYAFYIHHTHFLLDDRAVCRVDIKIHYTNICSIFMSGLMSRWYKKNIKLWKYGNLLDIWQQNQKTYNMKSLRWETAFLLLEDYERRITMNQSRHKPSVVEEEWYYSARKLELFYQ